MPPSSLSSLSTTPFQPQPRSQPQPSLFPTLTITASLLRLLPPALSILTTWSPPFFLPPPRPDAAPIRLLTLKTTIASQSRRLHNFLTHPAASDSDTAECLLASALSLVQAVFALLGPTRGIGEEWKGVLQGAVSEEKIARWQGELEGLRGEVEGDSERWVFGRVREYVYAEVGLAEGLTAGVERVLAGLESPRDIGRRWVKRGVYAAEAGEEQDENLDGDGQQEHGGQRQLLDHSGESSQTQPKLKLKPKSEPNVPIPPEQMQNTEMQDLLRWLSPTEPQFELQSLEKIGDINITPHFDQLPFNISSDFTDWPEYQRWLRHETAYQSIVLLHNSPNWDTYNLTGLATTLPRLPSTTALFCNLANLESTLRTLTRHLLARSQTQTPTLRSLLALHQSHHLLCSPPIDITFALLLELLATLPSVFLILVLPPTRPHPVDILLRALSPPCAPANLSTLVLTQNTGQERLFFEVLGSWRIAGFPDTLSTGYRARIAEITGGDRDLAVLTNRILLRAPSHATATAALNILATQLPRLPGHPAGPHPSDPLTSFTKDCATDSFSPRKPYSIDGDGDFMAYYAAMMARPGDPVDFLALSGVYRRLNDHELVASIVRIAAQYRNRVAIENLVCHGVSLNVEAGEGHGIPLWLYILAHNDPHGEPFQHILLTTGHLPLDNLPHTHTSLTPSIYEAASIGSLFDILRHIRAGGNPSVTTKYGWAPLHQAAMNGDLMVAVVLVNAGGRLNTVSDMYKTALDCAVEGGFTGIQRFLRERGAKMYKELLQEKGRRMWNLY